MIIEAVTAVALLVRPPDGVSVAQAALGVGLVAVVWLSTAALQAPRHRELARGFDAGAHRRLVVGNRLRTAAWTARGGVVVWMLATALG